ncbi:molecular chaperone GrpE [Nocardioides daedukensis]|uniref:Protein GrpE n=1 Tax=Nocardioides daedukensis TaxID=634462 RepID=A0A7Y9S267_9ACTN|nr:molecular chaperone GrpE [Nocardioides daedukensis]
MTQGPDESPQDPSQDLPDPADAGETVEEGAAAEAAPSPGSPGEPGDVAGEDPSESATDELTVTKMELEERTLDLQRLQAEFLNYKRRVDRDRELIKENATFSALAPITEVLDNIDRAKEHGPLDDGFRAVADQLERVVAGQGLVRYGAPGDVFDPTIHDALSHLGEDAEVEVTTVKIVAKGGYKIGERVVRAAQVLVVDPAAPGAASAPADAPAAE